jgi:hypothetical protein
VVSSQLLLLFNLLAESTACAAVVLFAFARLLKHDSNTKGKKSHFLKDKLNIPQDDGKHMGIHTSLVKNLNYQYQPCIQQQETIMSLKKMQISVEDTRPFFEEVNTLLTLSKMFHDV